MPDANQKAVATLPRRAENQKAVQVTVEWDQKHLFCREHLTPEDAETFLAYLNWRANGKKTATFMKDRNMVWSDLSRIYHSKKVSRELFGLMKASERLGEEFRQRVREDEADRRAVEGTKKPVFYKGEVCGHVIEYSDTMLAIQLKQGAPEKYMDRKDVRHSGAVLQLHIAGVDRDPKEEKVVHEEQSDDNPPVEPSVASDSDTGGPGGVSGGTSDDRSESSD